MQKYKKYTIKPYAVIRNGYKYSVTSPDGQHIGSAETLSDARYLVNADIDKNDPDYKKYRERRTAV